MRAPQSMRWVASAACCPRQPPARESPASEAPLPARGPGSEPEAAEEAAARHGTSPGVVGTSPALAGGEGAQGDAEAAEAGGHGYASPSAEDLSSESAGGTGVVGETPGASQAQSEDVEAQLPPRGPSRPSGCLRLLSDGAAQQEQEGGPGSLGDSVAAVTTFRGCEDLCRGMLLAKVMEGQGRVFSSSSGSAATYAHSKPVDRIDAFISHNWSVSRPRKFGALAVHFNLLPAVLMTCVALVVVVALAVSGLTPTYHVPWSEYPRGMACRVTVAPIFLLCLFSAHRLRLSEKTVFLDKTCIDQERPEVQRQGIEKLGAFLRHSNTMVAVYSDVYLRKLWTVYEVANFLVLHPIERMHIIPTVVPLVLIVGVVIGYIADIAALLIEMYCGVYCSQRFTLLGLSYLLVMALRNWNRERAAMRSRLEDFSLSKCTCAKESDRPLVYGNIAALMRAAQAVERRASDEEALAAFDTVVQDNLSQLLLTSIGSHGLKLSHMFVVIFLSMGNMWLDKAAGMAYGMPARVLFVDATRHLTMICCMSPMVLAIWTACASVCLHFKGIPELLFTFCALLPGSAFGLAVSFIIDRLVRWSYQSTTGVYLLISFSALLAFSTALVFGCKPHK